MTLYYDPRTKNLRNEWHTESHFERFPWWLAFIFPLNLIWLLGRQYQEPGSFKGSDAENIAEIIKAGNENNVDNLELELDRDVAQGLDLKALEDQGGVNLTLGQKGKTRYKLKIQYK